MVEQGLGYSGFPRPDNCGVLGWFFFLLCTLLNTEVIHRNRNFVSLGQAVRCDGSALLPYKTELLEVLHKTLRLKSIFGFETSGQLLRYLLRGLTHIYPLNFRSVDEDFDKPFTEYMPIKV